MICKVCGSEFDRDNFEVCPFCLTPAEDDKADAAVLENTENENTVLVDMQSSVMVEMGDDSNNIDDASEKAISETVSDDLSSEEPDEIKSIEMPHIILNCVDDLSVRAKNVFVRNQINTFEELMDFLKEHKVSELRGAGTGVEEEVSNIISKVLCGAYSANVGDTVTFMDDSKSLEEMVIDAVNAGQQPNVHINNLFDLSTRSYNVLRRNGADDILSIAKLLSVTSTKNLKGAGASFVKEMPAIMERFLAGAYSNVSAEANISLSLEDCLIDAVGTRAYDIYLRRALGETLQEIADNPSDPRQEVISRERVRQIESKFFRKHKQLLLDVVNEVWGDKKYFFAQELRDLYGSEELGTILVALLRNTDEYDYLDFADCFVKKTEYEDVERKLLSLVTEFVGDGIDLYENIEGVDELFLANGIEFMGLGELINLLDKYGFKFYGDFVTKGKVSYAKLCLNIIKEKFPNGIKLSQDNDNTCEELKTLRELAQERYGNIGIPEGDRAFSARLSSYLVICDRGRAIPEENIQIDFSVLNDIKEYIDQYEVEKIYYSELFANFEGVLQMTSNVNNYYFLHGVLMLYFPEEYEYYRDYLIRKNATGPVESVAERIRKYICEMARPVSKVELRNRFPGFTNIMIDLQFDEDPYLVQWEYNTYSCLDLLSYSEDEKKQLCDLLDGVIEKNQGFVSDNILYDVTNKEMNSFLEKNKITMPMQLFYFCSKIYKDQYEFRHPNIGKPGLVELLTIKEVAMYLLGNPTRLSYTKYLEITERMKWTSVSVSSTFYKIEDGFCRISEDEYLAEDLFNVDENDIDIVKNYLLNLLEEKDYISLLDFNDFSNLPEIDYEWNTFLLETIIMKYVPELKIVSPDYKDRRYQRSLIVKSELGIRSYSELVAYVFRNNGYSSLSEGRFLSFLVVNGLAYKMIPKEIGNSDFFKVEKEFYVLK